jgi:hypothetical protein
MPNTLGLDDDLDGNELISDIQVSFSIKFLDKEAEACRTVGDIFTLLRDRFAVHKDGGQRCASAMAFYRLRKTFLEMGAKSKLRPTLRLEGIVGLSAKAVFVGINSHTGFILPRLPFAITGKIGIFSLIAGLIMLLISSFMFPSFWFIPPLISLSGIVLIRLDCRQFPSDCHTVGDLALKVSRLNFGNLVAEGARHRDEDIWNALIEVLSEYTTLSKADISPETLLLQSQLRAA